MKLLIARTGDVMFADLMYKLRCKGCHGQPTSIYLCASYGRKIASGVTPDWYIELRPELARATQPDNRTGKFSGEESEDGKVIAFGK